MNDIEIMCKAKEVYIRCFDDDYKYPDVLNAIRIAVEETNKDFAEPRKKQIQINAEQIRALQKQNGELTDELTKKSDTNHQLVEQLAELEEENAELKCECRRCVYTDSPCVLSDYGKDRNGICDHFKDVFDKNAELEETLGKCAKMPVLYCLGAKETITKAKDLLKQWLQTSKASGCDNINIVSDTEQFISEVEK